MYVSTLLYALCFLMTQYLLPCQISNDIHLNEAMIEMIYRHPSDETLFETSWMDQEKLAVSLGYNCITAAQLSNEKIRNIAFPFDWCETAAYGLIRCINNDFKDFLSIENLKPDQGSRVIDDLYDIKIVHDFPFQRIENFTFNTMQQFYTFDSFIDLVTSQYDETYAKLMRRVERFRNLSMFKGKIYFVRSSQITKSQSLELLEALNSRFKDNDFTLVVINHTDEFKTPWNIPKIQNFFIDYDHNFRPLEECYFTEIFKKAGLI